MSRRPYGASCASMTSCAVRYLQPWCAVARERLAADANPLLALADAFAQDLGPPPSSRT
ncbi:MAG TPA: hypothetical protein VLS25_09735 [Dehalococcoidia bacterium]|nr:hypothetical protein [Dehalococcoidia bacterium]